MNLTTGPSDSEGFAEASWNTSEPNRKGNGGTTTGSYNVTLSNVTLDGYTWDNQALSTAFTIQ